MDAYPVYWRSYMVKQLQDMHDALRDKIDTAVISYDYPMEMDHTSIPTEAVTLLGDTAIQRKAWVSGLLKLDSFIYFSTATTTGGTVTFWITDTGTSGGSAVFNNVYADSIQINPYNNGAVYNVSAITVAGDKKSITATIGQVTNVILNIVQVVSAVNGIQCNLLVLGD